MSARNGAQSFSALAWLSAERMEKMTSWRSDSSATGAEAATAIATAAAEPTAATGATAAGAAGGAATCVATPELTEGPYFVDEKLSRSDIRSDPASGAVKEGLPLALAFNVSQIAGGSCTPLANALVDVWHCDAAGVYSDVTDNAQGFDAVGQKFLRGQQTTDASGVAQFTTIFPGWYSGRAVHIHFKVRADAGSGQTYEFTSQLFFDEADIKQVYAQPPYASKGLPDTSNASDGIYRGGGDQLLLALAPASQGYTTAFNVALDLSDAGVGASDSAGRGGPGGPGGPPPNGAAPGRLPTQTP